MLVGERRHAIASTSVAGTRVVLRQCSRLHREQGSGILRYRGACRRYSIVSAPHPSGPSPKQTT